MVKMAGFLTGSATAIALILLVLGLPEWQADEPAPVEVIAQPPEPEPSTEPAPETTPLPEPVASLPVEPEPGPVALPEAAAASHWHSFWSPFGSRIAADGFVSRLEAVTGFDYRVITIDNGFSEVAFAYSDDAERDAMLATIASSTGLDLPGS